MAGLLLVTRHLLASVLIFSFMLGGTFARRRTDHFLVELEGGNGGNKESWQDKIIRKIENMIINCVSMHACVNWVLK